MIDRIKKFYENNRMWMYLGQSITISVLLAVLIILIDSKMLAVLDYIPSFLLTSVDLAKDILGILAGSLLTITTFTFSTIMVVLTMYSSEFSPRVVNNFLNDKITMKVLGVFIGGFFYCILALFFMRNAFSEYEVLSATIAVFYSGLCIIYFVIFVYRVSSSIQATKLISRLYDESYTIIERTLENRENKNTLAQYEKEAFKVKLDIVSDRNGYLELIGFKAILDMLKDVEGKVIIRSNIGDFISKNEILASLYYNDERIKEDLENNLHKKLIREFSVEEERVEYNDYRFSLQKIVDIALRAISPGINDPNTAIDCINILGVLLSMLGKIDGNYNVIKSDDSKTELVFEDFDFKEDIYYTFYQIIHYGKKDISIVLALLNSMKTIFKSATEEKKKLVLEFTDYVYESCIENFSQKLDIDMINQAKKEIR